MGLLRKKESKKQASTPTTAAKAGVPSDAAAYLKSLEDPDVVERVFCKIDEGHVFKLPPRQTAGGWRGADWRNEVWQGIVKVVERSSQIVVLLVDKRTGSIFAVCPVKEGAVDRCVDSSRYFVLRVENADGRHMFIGIAFNERNDAFDFNVALEDAKKERAAEGKPIQLPTIAGEDYSLKAGEKIKVTVPKRDNNATPRKKDTNSSMPFFSTGAKLQPPKHDRPKIGQQPRSHPEKPDHSFPTTFESDFSDNNAFAELKKSTASPPKSENNNNNINNSSPSFVETSYNSFWSLFS